jgi:hypothetical protein
MRAFLAAVTVASLAMPALSPAAAQQQHMQEYGQPDKDKTAAEKAADKAAAEAYQRSINAIPDKGATDPWGTVRSNDAPKPAPTKTAKSKAKTGSAEAKTGSAEAKPQ